VLILYDWELTSKPIINELFFVAGDTKEVVLILYDWELISEPRAIGDIKLPVCHTHTHTHTHIKLPVSHSHPPGFR